MGLQSMGSVLASILVVMPDELTGALEGAVNSLEAASVFQVNCLAATLKNVREACERTLACGSSNDVLYSVPLSVPLPVS